MSSAENRQPNKPAWLDTVATMTGICCVAWLGWLAFTPPPQGSDGASGFTRRSLVPCIMDNEGYLRGQLYGNIQTRLDWRGDSMRCDGMQRPEGQGIRLVFDEHLDDEEPGLLIVVGIAGAIPGQTVKELPANITIIDQANGQFFSTQEEPRCWTTFNEQLLLSGTTEETWRINGQIYCASALAELAGSGSVTLGDIEFSGLFKPGTGQN
jgi:hypothetical protein